MPNARWKNLLVALATLAFGAAVPGVARAADAPKEATPEQAEFFEKKIRPVLVDKCYGCHSTEAKANKKLKGKYYADSLEGMLKGGESEKPSIVPGDPDKSMLIITIRYDDKETPDHEALLMPPPKKGVSQKLPDEVIKDFEKWVKDGAPAPKEFAKPPAPKDGKAAATAAEAAAAKSHWAFQPPREPKVPEAAGAAAGGARNEIDQFVLGKLAEKGLAPSPAADRRTLIRRATFDLTGLPPTPAEVEALEKDQSPDAFEKVIDRLLASPRYGERWGRHWLDVARYADTKGYVFQEERRYPFAYTYRDWVIGATNADMPYDQFLIRQIAADKLEGPDKNPADLAAMGFLTVGRRFLNNPPDIIDDRIDVITRGTMAFTVACARCHDHKFDPIPTAEYYGLYGVFASSTEPKDLPLLPRQGAPTPASLAFDKELKAREAVVEAYLRDKPVEIFKEARSAKGVADFLFGASQPGGPDKDVSRYLANRWKDYLTRQASAKDAAFSAWRAYAAIPADKFAEMAKDVTEAIKSTKKAGDADVHPLIADALIAKPPSTLREVADRYGEVLAKFDGEAVLPDASQESLRNVLRGDGSPYAVPADEVKQIFKTDERANLTALKRKVDELHATNLDAPARAMVMVDDKSPADANVLVRGNANNLGSVAPRKFLSAASGGKEQPLTEGSGRLQLARAIASRDNPLTARVMVNRVWLRHFGSGIVRTPSDFGLRADPPTHPELLDFLALRFMEDGWSLKKLHRRMMLSATYQQASDDKAAASAADPENLLLWRQNRQRLDFESTRDALLYVTGKLDETIGGRSISLDDAGAVRRTVYGAIDRQNLPGMFRAFDFASPDMHSPQRPITTVPQQALFFMNSPFVMMQSRRLIERPDVAATTDAAVRVRHLYRLLYGRDPAPDEVELGAAFVASEEGADQPLAASRLWQYGFGRFDSSSDRAVDFQPLPFFTGDAWQGGKKIPDKKLGYALLTAGGGHVGNDQSHAVVRRWVSPIDGTVNVRSTLSHADARGDGVRGRIISSRRGLVGEWTAHNGKVEANVPDVNVSVGDTLDFVADCRGSVEYDNFAWSPTITLAAAANSAGQTEWNSARDFGGPMPPAQRSAWEKYVQVLLESNEFVFVD